MESPDGSDKRDQKQHVNEKFDRKDKAHLLRRSVIRNVSLSMSMGIAAVRHFSSSARLCISAVPSLSSSLKGMPLDPPFPSHAIEFVPLMFLRV